jgi:hypothetical protein
MRLQIDNVLCKVERPVVLFEVEEAAVLHNTGKKHPFRSSGQHLVLSQQYN